MPITNKISMNIDIDDPKIENVPIVTQGDTIELTVNVLKSGVAYDLSNVTTISLVTTRPDNLIVVDEGTVLTGNQAVFNMSTRSTAVAGTDRIVVQAYDDSLDRVSTMAGVLVVMDDMSNNEQALGDDDQSLIKQVLGDGPDIISAAQTATTAANDATTAANTATSAANTAADNANTAADSANTAATSATNAAASANTAADAANTATQNANVATTAANTATENTNTATQEANDATTAANSAATAANDAADNVNDAINSATTNWLAPVAAYSDVATTYTTPSLGDTVQVLDTGFVYRYDGTQWVYTQGYSATAIADINAKLTNQDSQSATLLHGLSAITTDQATATAVRIFGRTLVNLLGKDGNCESLAPFTPGGITPTLSTSQIKSGSNSIKFSPTTNSGSFDYKDYDFSLSTANYYLVSAFVYIESYTSGTIGIQIQDKGGGSARYTVSVDTTKIGKWQLIHFKVPNNNSITTNGFRLVIGAVSAGASVSYFDSVSIYEIPQSIYDKIDVDSAYTGDVLAAKFPYVDSIQHVMNPYIKNSGKNLIPPFTSGEWTLNPNAKVISDYELELDATAAGQSSSYVLNCLPNQTYTLSVGGTRGTGYRLRLFENGVNKMNVTDTVPTATYTTSATAKQISIIVDCAIAGTFTFTDPQLELGSTATPFEPQNESYLYVAQDVDKNPIVLASNNDGSVADEVYQKNGQWYRLNRFKRDMVLDGSFGWAFHIDNSAYKVVRIDSGVSDADVSLGGLFNATKYDGKIVAFNSDDASSADTAMIYYSGTNNRLKIRISDIDSGWGETYTPSAGEIQSYFFGWKMNNGTFGTAYNGTGTKTWVPIGDTDNTRATTVLPTADAPTITEGKIDHYKLTYQLAQATEEAIEVEGSLDLIDGGNQLEVGEAVIVREKANPVYNGSDSYLINHTYNSTSFLQHKTDEILTIFKNGVIDKYWTIITASNAYGNQTAYILSSDYDSNAEYTVTYTALDTYKLSSAENNVEITYNTNIKTVVDALVQRQEDDETDISVLKIQMIDAIARLTAGGL